jgi:hypothetical protein
MNSADFLSPAQLVGYLAFVLGVGCFLQSSDRRFKQWMVAECVAYMAHFALLGNPTAVASSALSTIRSILSLYTRSVWVAFAVVTANLAFGMTLATRWYDWLPLAASCIGTLALFLLTGIAMRLVMLVGTCLWIANNIIVGSIGGTALEIVIASVNVFTILKMWRQKLSPRAP